MTRPKFDQNNLMKLVEENPLTDPDDEGVELSTRERQIIQLRRRGFSHQMIATALNSERTTISHAFMVIRKKYEVMGRTLNQDRLVADSMTLYGEVEQQAWELYYSLKSDKKFRDANKCLATIMDARGRHDKLLQDLGHMQRAAIEHKHTVAPFLERWESQKPEEKQVLVASVIEGQFSVLAPPEPPRDEEIIEVEEVPEDQSE